MKKFYILYIFLLEIFNKILNKQILKGVEKCFYVKIR